MEKVLTRGQLLFGIAIAAFGVENVICAHLGLSVRGVPWFPENPFLGYLTGVALLAAGLSIVANIGARWTAILLGILFLLYVLLIEASRVAAKPMGISVRTVFFETLAIGSAALTLAGTLPSEGSGRWDSVLDKLIKSGPYLFGASSVVFGIDHFLVLEVIASLVPAWMHAGMFWAYLTGTAFMVAGISILLRRMDRWAAFMLGTMFALWFVLLHSPRSVSATLSHNPNVQNEWSSALIALAMCGGCWIVGWHAQQRRARALPRPDFAPKVGRE
ncbi:MAG: hypothetical protein ACLPOO_07345 [Terriglobales bacterium]|jgi:uncharacterized membrane protein YphA (DoxX/SURF4 family)